MTEILDLSKACDTIGCLNSVQYVCNDGAAEGAGYLCSCCFAEKMLRTPDNCLGYRQVPEPFACETVPMNRQHETRVRQAAERV